MIEFDFPPLGPTGAGPIFHRGRQGEVIWICGPYRVSLQEDHFAIAYRCHYPGGSTPCDVDTAVAFMSWVEKEARVPA